MKNDQTGTSDPTKVATLIAPAPPIRSFHEPSRLSYSPVVIEIVAAIAPPRRPTAIAEASE